MKRIFLLFLVAPFFVNAQDDLLKELETTESKAEAAVSTFKGTRLCNGHSVKTTPANTLEFIFGHRFGPINDGYYEMFGLDQAYVRLGFDYGITDRLSVSVGRNSVDKTLDGYAKFQLLRQTIGDHAFPISVTTLTGMAYKFSPRKNSDTGIDGFKSSDRIAYTLQALIARKFTSALSLQVMPTWIHKNRVAYGEENEQFAIGVGGRLKFTKSMAFTTEYYHNLSFKDGSPYNHPIAFGLDIETGGHVFQIIFTNAIGLTERGFITETTDDFFGGDIHFGFNVTRTFQF